ncbi:MAG: hypothetical protein H0U57_00110 [Tatlockia sp.]|nr:hypothetical protein [Tatlockia sp.]
MSKFTSNPTLKWVGCSVAPEGPDRRSPRITGKIHANSYHMGLSLMVFPYQNTKTYPRDSKNKTFL